MSARVQKPATGHVQTLAKPVAKPLASSVQTLAKPGHITKAETGGWLIQRPGSVYHTDDLFNASASLSIRSRKRAERPIGKFGAVLPNWINNAATPVPDAVALLPQSSTTSKENL